MKNIGKKIFLAIVAGAIALVGMAIDDKKLEMEIDDKVNEALAKREKNEEL